MNKCLVVWPKSETVVHINYHYTQFGEIIDYLQNKLPEQIIALDCDVENKDIINIIDVNNITKVIMQVNYENAQNAFKMCEKIKEYKNIPILAYGYIPIKLQGLFLDSKFDVIHVNGDPEICMLTFIKHYEQNIDVSILKHKLKGAKIIKNQNFIVTEKGEYILPNEWGFSKKESVPIDVYDKIKGKNRYVLNISRGCPFGCAHCLVNLSEGRKERRRSIENVKNAIEQVKNDYKHIKIWAANFTLVKEYVDNFCDMMITYFPEITWECSTRVDLVKDEQMLSKMYKAGCRKISLGIESLNSADLIETKKFKTEEIEGAISRIQSCKINVNGLVMVGIPGQTKEDIIETFTFLQNNNVNIRATVYTPYQDLTEKDGLLGLSKYNRKTFENNNIVGVSDEQLLQLVKTPGDFKKLLKI